MQLQETERIEFKRSVNERICKTIIAFANGTGGEIYVGIDDFDNVLDLEDIDGDMLKISNYVHDLICPELLQFVHIEPIELEGKRIIAVNVESGDEKPYYLANKGLIPAGVFTRLGPATVPMSRRDIRRMIRETDGDFFDSRHAKVQDLTFTYAESFFKLKGVDFSPERFKALGLYADDGYFSNLALLISDQNPYNLKCATFNDDACTEFLNSLDCDGSILKQFNDAFSFLQSASNLRSYFPSHTRVDVRDYPLYAVREGLLNSIIHRDYDESLYTPTLIKMSRTALSFTSYGDLYHVREKEIFSNVSSARNPRLLALFHRFNEVEAYGSGLPRIQELYQYEKLKATVEVGNFFTLRLPNINTTHNPYLSRTRNDGPGLRGGHEAFDKLNAMGALPTDVKAEYDRECERRAEALRFQRIREAGEARGMSARDAFQHALAAIGMPTMDETEDDAQWADMMGPGAPELKEKGGRWIPQTIVDDTAIADEAPGTKRNVRETPVHNTTEDTGRSAIEHLLITFASDKKGFSREEAQEALGAGRDTTLKVINGLVKEGKLEKVGRARATRYRVVG